MVYIHSLTFIAVTFTVDVVQRRPVHCHVRLACSRITVRGVYVRSDLEKFAHLLVCDKIVFCCVEILHRETGVCILQRRVNMLGDLSRDESC